MKIPVKTVSTVLVLGACLLLFVVTGCDSKGPAGQVFEKIDKPVETVKDAANEAVDKMVDKMDGDGPAEDLGEKLDKAAEKVKIGH